MSGPDTNKAIPDLLYPFYLDVDMSMAFAAALAGGVALETEQLDRVGQASEAVKNIRGSLRLWRAGGVEAGRSDSDASDIMSESRLSRHHTVASVFIDLYDELRQRGGLVEEFDAGTLEVGEIVSARMGPAVAPLRRVIDQVIRMLDLMAPIIDAADDDSDSTVPVGNRQQRRAQAKAKKAQPESDDDDDNALIRQMRRLFVALREDLDHSGMVDIVVRREDGPSAVLTLDKRFISAPTIELLHTSQFTVVGKVSQVWPGEDDVVNLYRRSVLSLVPSLTQATVWGVFALLSTLARSMDVNAIEEAARAATGATSDSGVDESAPHESGGLAGDAAVAHEAASDPQGDDDEEDDVLLGDDIAALHPVITGPAFQVLPLAICS